MDAIASICKAGKTPTRANVLAAIRKTNIPPAQSVLGLRIKFQANGNLAGSPGYLFHVDANKQYVEISSK
jgi:hypothetical protein